MIHTYSNVFLVSIEKNALVTYTPPLHHRNNECDREFDSLTGPYFVQVNVIKLLHYRHTQLLRISK